ncbi:gliding motility associated protein GldN [Emticicia oligotrophica DSM 17448]|uniref:Gliding motility associated protein GldN n=1 Tax=Emticicia oligotrophica (strain DSM 17448 / CIP 109782 / MTCC 6937 / GPTSA100-15) TaxID=929562 RepID=A0ABM5MZ40_EMTOG|nr:MULTISPECIES: gliding motility protein GldN [Emticicia]AFK02446.1 gliding motility associated protein GldN [Emticicia oligotrophica DSM 17448]
MKKLQGMAFGLSLIISQFAVAQEKSNNYLNPLSLRPIHEENVMFKTTLWRRIDLKEKQNQPLFSKGSEITRHLIDAVKAGLIEAYDNDSLTTRLTLEQFNERLLIKAEGGGLSEEEKAAGFSSGGDDGWGGDSGGAAKPSTAGAAPAAADPGAGVEIFANQLSILELKEDWIFDKQRSRQYFDIQTLKLIIPADQTTLGFDRPVCVFKYKELERYFRSNPKCIWYNATNGAAHKNLADAFELRLFHGKIVKKANALDNFLDDIYKSPREGMLKSEQLEYELMEFEHNLWEY